jgi:hypothetical protein
MIMLERNGFWLLQLKITITAGAIREEEAAWKTPSHE